MEEIINTQIESGQEIVEDSAHYIEAIKSMKQNTVSKEAYQKLQEENRNLLRSLVNGENVDLPAAKEQVDIDALRRELFTSGKSNLEHAKTVVSLRNALLQQGQPDPFLPIGHNVQPTQQDIECANRTAAAFEHCIEYADGNNDIFTNELMRITRDTFRPNMKRR